MESFQDGLLNVSFLYGLQSLSSLLRIFRIINGESLSKKVLKSLEVYFVYYIHLKILYS